MVALQYKSTMGLYGQVDTLFQLSSPVIVNRFTGLSIDLKKEEEVEGTVMICLYEESSLDIAMDCPSRCRNVDNGGNTIYLEEMFHSKLFLYSILG